jgi:hypothetical protein
MYRFFILYVFAALTLICTIMLLLWARYRIRQMRVVVPVPSLEDPLEHHRTHNSLVPDSLFESTTVVVTNLAFEPSLKNVRLEVDQDGYNTQWGRSYSDLNVTGMRYPASLRLPRWNSDISETSDSDISELPDTVEISELHRRTTEISEVSDTVEIPKLHRRTTEISEVSDTVEISELHRRNTEITAICEISDISEFPS